MTMPRERLNALNNTREFLRSLLNSKETPRVPREIRRQAYSCLKHFPSEYHTTLESKRDCFVCEAKKEK